MRKLLWLFLFVPAMAFTQVSNPSIISVATAPTGSCSAGLPNQQVVSTGVQYSCQGGTWAAIGGGGGSGTVSGQANGVIPLATGATAIGAQSHLSDNGSAITSTLPIVQGTAPTTGVHIGALGSPTNWNLDTTTPATTLLSISGSIPSASGPNQTFYDDFVTGTAVFPYNIGSPTGNSCLLDQNVVVLNHPGIVSVISGTGASGTGASCTLTTGIGGPGFVVPNQAIPWQYETEVNVPVLPGTTAAQYQFGLGGAPTLMPWTSGNMWFYLSSTNSVANDWYCGYASTYNTPVLVDSTVAATTTGWPRLSMVGDGTKVHWYINNVEVCGTGVAVGSVYAPYPSPAVWQAVTLTSSTSVKLLVDYVIFNSQVTR